MLASYPTDRSICRVDGIKVDWSLFQRVEKSQLWHTHQRTDAYTSTRKLTNLDKREERQRQAKPTPTTTTTTTTVKNGTKRVHEYYAYFMRERRLPV